MTELERSLLKLLVKSVLVLLANAGSSPLTTPTVSKITAQLFTELDEKSREI